MTSAAAQYAVKKALRRGDLVKGDCVARDTGNGPCLGWICGHHDDYDKPLDVIWLCTRHHNELHLARKNDARA